MERQAQFEEKEKPTTQEEFVKLQQKRPSLLKGDLSNDNARGYGLESQKFNNESYTETPQNLERYRNYKPVTTINRDELTEELNELKQKVQKELNINEEITEELIDNKIHEFKGILDVAKMQALNIPEERRGVTNELIEKNERYLESLNRMKDINDKLKNMPAEMEEEQISFQESAEGSNSNGLSLEETINLDELI